MSKYPHELSGGQARRVGIARALALNPDFLIADEPTSGLDVSAAAAILNLMKDLGRRLGLTYLVITHNLSVVGFVADRIAVMYLGQIVEIGPGERVLAAPAHPYTVGLLSALSEPDPSRAGRRHRLPVPGEIPSPAIRRLPAASTPAARSRPIAALAPRSGDRAGHGRLPSLAARARIGGGPTATLAVAQRVAHADPHRFRAPVRTIATPGSRWPTGPSGRPHLAAR